MYAYVRKEAVLSSQIKGTQSSLSDFLLLENDEAPGVPPHGVQEVSNYVTQLNHGLSRLRGGLRYHCDSSAKSMKCYMERSRQRQTAWRVPDQPELDRRHASGDGRFRPSSARACL
jgi:hypothetical protein